MDTRTGRDGTSNWSKGPMWLRQRSLGKNKPRRIQASHDLVRRLGVEASLPLGETHFYHYPMDWNQKGTLLAAGQSANLVGVWDVFKQQKVCTMDTGHTSTAFPVQSVKFIPHNDAQLVACQAQDGLRIMDISKNENFLVHNRPYINDIAVHPSEPNLIWSISWHQDTWVGHIECCDTRQAHECSSYRYRYRTAKRIAINPMRSNMLAVGFLDGDCRLFDSRVIKSGASSPLIAHFEPIYRADCDIHYDLRGLAFNSDGSELLVSVLGEQVYLFNTYEPWEKYRLFDLPKPLVSGKQELVDPSTSTKLKPYSYIKELRKQRSIGMDDELKTLCDDILSRDSTFKGPSNIIDHINESLERKLPSETNSNYQLSFRRNENIIDYLNVLLEKVTNCPDLYRARAIALGRRGFGGDYYQSMRDCCCALALKPKDSRTIRCLSLTVRKLKNGNFPGLSQFIKDAIKEFGDHDDSTSFSEMLPASNESVTIVNKNTAPNSRLPYRIEASPGNSKRRIDYSRRYRSKKRKSYCSEVNFFGSRDEFVISGCGSFYVWDKNTTNIVKTIDEADSNIVLPHPSICMIATSGYDDAIKLWSPIGEESQGEDK